MPDPRAVVFADLGYARTWDDEGLLGNGASLSGSAGWHVTQQLAIQAILERIQYYRDVEYLTFDGRMLFAGAESAFQSRTTTVRPCVTVGVGVFNEKGIGIQKRQLVPGTPRIEERLERRYTSGALTDST